MDEKSIREDVIRLFLADVNTNLSCIREEINKLSDKMKDKSLNDYVLNNISDLLDETENDLHNTPSKMNRKLLFQAMKNDILIQLRRSL